MVHYEVLASDNDSALVALRDSAGRCHLGRALGPPPAPGTPLCGDAPAVGVRALRCAITEVPYPVALVLLNCEVEPALAIASGKLTR
jgi:hypothetical protein